MTNEITGVDYWKSVYKPDALHNRRKPRETLRGQQKLIGELSKLLKKGKVSAMAVSCLMSNYGAGDQGTRPPMLPLLAPGNQMLVQGR